MTTATRTNGHAPRVAQVTAREPGLMDALLALAAEAPKLTRDATGQIQNRAYRYVTLDGLLDAIVPLLIEHELVWSARPTTHDGQPALRYRLTHVPSGESDEDVMPLIGATDSQAMGSAITYCRRYALLAVLNLAPGEDDDGMAASLAVSPPQMREQNRNQPTAAPPQPSERQLSEAQQRLLRARLGAAKLGPVKSANIVALAKGEPARQSADEDAAKRWLDRELDRLPARLVDAVLEGIAACPPF